MTHIQEILLRLETDYRGHPYHVTGHALYTAIARRVDADTRRRLAASHGVLLPAEWGEYPPWHPQEGSLGKLATGLREVETYADLSIYRDSAHRWLLDSRPRDAHNTLPIRTHGGRQAIAPTRYFGRPPEQRDHKRSVDWLVHAFLHDSAGGGGNRAGAGNGDTAGPTSAGTDADGDGEDGILPINPEVLDGLRLGGARNFGFGETSLVDSQLIDFTEVDYSWLRGAENYRLELLTPYVLWSEYPGADDQSVPSWWAPSPRQARAHTNAGASKRSDATPTLRRRRERLIQDGQTYALGTVDHGQVVGYAGDRPIETARNGLLRIGSHSRYGFGELRVLPAGMDRVHGEIESPNRATGGT